MAELSYPQSLAARGEYAKAVAAYEECIEQAPENPEPYLRIARLLRDEWERPEEEARWFRRVRSEAELSVHRDLQVSRELIEVYRSRFGDPRRAAPELARILEVHSDSPADEWAREELARIKALMTEQEQDD